MSKAKLTQPPRSPASTRWSAAEVGHDPVSAALLGASAGETPPVSNPSISASTWAITRQLGALTFQPEGSRTENVVTARRPS